MGDNSHIWEYSNIENVIEKLKSKKDLLQRTILTCTSATSLSVKSVDQSDLQILLDKSGTFDYIVLMSFYNGLLWCASMLHNLFVFPGRNA